MIANQDTLLKSAYMNEWYLVVVMNITFNLTVYLKKHNWPLLDHDPSWPLHDLFEPSITLRSSQGFFLPNLVAIGHCYANWPLLDPSWPQHDLWSQQCIVLWSGVLLTKFGGHRTKKTKQNKANKHFFKDTTISIGIENYMNFQNHPNPPSYNIDVAQKICISRTISLHNIIIQIFRHPQISPSLMKKIHTPQFHHPPPFQNKTTTTTTTTKKQQQQKKPP